MDGRWWDHSSYSWRCLIAVHCSSLSCCCCCSVKDRKDTRIQSRGFNTLLNSSASGGWNVRMYLAAATSWHRASNSESRWTMAKSYEVWPVRGGRNTRKSGSTEEFPVRVHAVETSPHNWIMIWGKKTPRGLQAALTSYTTTKKTLASSSTAGAMMQDRLLWRAQEVANGLWTPKSDLQRILRRQQQPQLAV